MIETIINNAIKARNYSLAIAKAALLPDAVSTPASRAFQNFAITQRPGDKRIGGLEKLIAHKKISTSEAAAILINE